MTAPEWVSIKEAGERLGVSPDTIRRKLKRGELEGRKTATPQGYIWEIAVPAAGTIPAPEPAAAGQDARELELTQLRERVAGFERERGELIAQRDAWQEQARRSSEGEAQLRELLARAQALARALPATASGESGLHEEAEVMAVNKGAVGKRKRWRFWKA